MRTGVDITGKRFGRLVVIGKDHSDGKRTWYKCQCDCGNVCVVRRNSLLSGTIKSCGCLRKERCSDAGKASLHDLTGQRFGLLTVLSRVPNRGHDVCWHCLCDCGNECDVIARALISGDTKSCGCQMRAHQSNVAEIAQNNITEHTNIGYLRSALDGKIGARNKSGVRGVYWDSSRGLWAAVIGFQGKQYHLCYSTDINVCAAARKDAEQHIFVDFLDWYDKEYPDRGKKPKHPARKKQKPGGDKK